MTNYFYFDQNNMKHGPVSVEQLRELAAQRIVAPHTPVETDEGHKGLAGQIPGLFAVASTPFTQPLPVQPSKVSPSQTASANVLHKTSIVIDRKAGLIDLGLNYAVLLDGIMIGDSKKGKTEFQVSPGRHTLELVRKLAFRRDQVQAFQKAKDSKVNRILGTTGLLGSKMVSFTIAEGEQVFFAAKNATTFRKAMLLVLNSAYRFCI